MIVVTFNHRDVVPRCLQALRLTLGPEDEALVIDNASTDGTAERVAAEHPWARLERAPRNLGFGAASNLGASLARGRYLVFLNPDTEPCPGWLKTLLAPLAAHPPAGLSTAKLLLAAAPGRVDTFGNDVHISGITPCRGWGEPTERYQETEEVSAVSGACFAIPAALFRRLGGFDERLFLYFEDTDLSLRARLAGFRCVAAPDSLVLHDHRPGFSADKLRYLERNRWWTLLKAYEWRSLYALAPVLAMAEVVAWGLAVRGGPAHLRGKARAWVELARWLPALAPARSAVQGTRRVTDAELFRLHSTRLSFAQAADGGLRLAGERAAALAFGVGRALAAAFGLRA